MAERIFVFFREFLFIAVLLIIGFMLLAAIPLRDTDVYIENKIRYYNNFGKEFDLGSYSEFSHSMQDPQKRLEIYNLISQKYDIGSYVNFSQEVARPTMSQNFYHSFTNLFDKTTWLLAWYILLSPVVIFGIIRGLMYSFSKILATAEKM